MYEFKTELLKSSLKLGFRDSANEKDLKNLDELIMKRQEEGWELVTYSYMTNSFGSRSFFAITFKRNK
ncbi:MAG: DUF4177 domain-containing protein [Clostridia bacterium]|nr:DUF4177 domain-containing protein [Clostridia bacterium]